MKHQYTQGTLHWLPSWAAVIANLDMCIASNQYRDFGYGGFVARNVLHKDYRQANVLCKELGKGATLHTYISLSSASNGSGRHTDDESVWCLQAIGQTLFRVWENGKKHEYVLSAGDMLYIPSKLEHEAIPLSARVLLSYGSE